MKKINTAVQAGILQLDVCIYEELANGELVKTTWLKRQTALKGERVTNNQTKATNPNKDNTITNPQISLAPQSPRRTPLKPTTTPTINHNAWFTLTEAQKAQAQSRAAILKQWAAATHEGLTLKQFLKAFNHRLSRFSRPSWLRQTRHYQAGSLDVRVYFKLLQSLWGGWT